MAMKFTTVIPNGDTMMHKGAIITGAFASDGSVMMNAVQDPNAEKVKRPLALVRDGQELPEAFNFVGTVRMNSGIIFHVLDMGEETSGSDAFTK